MPPSKQPSRFDLFHEGLLNNPESTSLNKMNTVSRRSRELNLVYAPSQLPENIQLPKYAIGDRCQWIPVNTTDWGTIIGQVLTPVEQFQATDPHWIWLYLVLLDSDSPSRQWVTTDWAEEDDLESFYSPARPLIFQSNFDEQP
jgi:hypothetical protein